MKAWFGRTIFVRIFLINIATVVLCLVVLGSTQVVLVNHYISRQSEESLGKNGDSIVALIQNNISLESLRGILSGFSRSTHSHIMVIDGKNKVLVSTGDSGFVSSPPDYLEPEYCAAVLQGERNSIIGTLGGMFSEVMFTLQVPILQNGQKAVGAVFISIPIPEKQKMMHELIQILLISALGVALISFLLSYMLAKRFSRPIRSIQLSAKEFTKGSFDARVGEDATGSGITEIAELAKTFNEMAYELEKVEEIRQSFISDVSHELRTPMTTISGFVYGMMDGTIPLERQNEYLKIVYDEISRLSRLVNTFLDISRMRADETNLHKSAFDINEVIRLTLIGLEQRLEEKEIQVELQFDAENCYVFADEDGIKRVLTNLLDNAVKFTNQGGVLTVQTETKQHEVFVRVHNTGCGIPEAQKQMIFERLYKVDKSRSINKEGTGIGLYLVKNIIRAHGKDIQVRSTEGEYAEFSFTLDKGKASPKREEKRLKADE